MVDAQVAVIRSSSSPLSHATSRRPEDVVLALSTRATAVERPLQPKAVEPVFRRPTLAPTSPRSQAATSASAGDQATADQAASKPQQPAAPPFEWLHLEVLPPGTAPNPRGYQVYSKTPRPEPVAVVLIDTAV